MKAPSLTLGIEEEYQIMDHEAQRCREILSRQPPAAARKGK